MNGNGTRNNDCLWRRVGLTGKRFSGMTEVFYTLIGVQITFLKIHRTVHLRSMVFIVHIPQFEMEEINKQKDS